MTLKLGRGHRFSGGGMTSTWPTSTWSGLSILFASIDCRQVYPELPGDHSQGIIRLDDIFLALSARGR